MSGQNQPDYAVSVVPVSDRLRDKRPVTGVTVEESEVAMRVTDCGSRTFSVPSFSALQVTTTAGNSQNTNNNLIIEPVSVTVATQDPTDVFAINDVVTVAAANVGTPTLPPSIGTADVSFTLVDADIVDEESFVLETLTDGTIMNSGLVEGNNGTLVNGTTDNIRWEIQGTDTATGTFSVIIRQGDDTATAKRVLEIFPNISLDPKQSNYIERVVGTQKKTLNDPGTSEPYISTEGSYRNGSRYVRVSNVAYKTSDGQYPNPSTLQEFLASVGQVALEPLDCVVYPNQ